MPKKVAVFLILLIMLSFISNHIEANTNTAFQNYRLAVQ